MDFFKSFGIFYSRPLDESDMISTFIRSLVFDIFLYSRFFFVMLLTGPFYLFVLKDSVRFRKRYGHIFLKCLKLIVGLDYRMKGLERIPNTPCILACKHQSAWETAAMMYLLPAYGIILKQELLRVPLFGYYLRQVDAIGIDRKKGARAILDMTSKAKLVLDKGLHIFIYPEGTRGQVGQKGSYKPGVYGLYQALDVPVVPIALNSGLFWPRRTLLKRKGCIDVEICQPILPGLSKADFMKELETKMEGACQKMPPFTEPSSS